jgi:hypothetical protein
MAKRRRIKQTTTLAERLTAQAGRLSELARNLPPGTEQTRLWRKVRQTETAVRIDQWLTSSANTPPGELIPLIDGHKKDRSSQGSL